MATARVGLITNPHTNNLIRPDVPINSEHGIVGSSSKIMELRREIKTVAASDIDVLILGETGTGKELVAHAIHNSSERKGNKLAIVNCPALPKDLLESELFGHSKDAYTSAKSNRKGRLRSGEKGTVFLDEIGDLSREAQARLLRFFQEKEIMSLGSDESVRINTRIIVATNRDLEECLHNGTLREDFFYRINSYEIRTPPLRERMEDLQELVWYFADKYSRGVKLHEIEPGIINLLNEQRFNGNVRSLERFVERGMVIAASDPESRTAKSGLVLKVGHVVGYRFIDNQPQRTAYTNLETLPTIDQAEKELIELALAKTDHNVTEAADILGISRRTLYRKISTRLINKSVDTDPK